jgi:hypothetical protein
MLRVIVTVRQPFADSFPRPFVPRFLQPPPRGDALTLPLSYATKETTAVVPPSAAAWGEAQRADTALSLGWHRMNLIVKRPGIA